MKTSTHAYTDVDIAEYVLGLAPPENATEIQSWLAQNNAAAACALKWEAYLLCMTDGLPGSPPSPDLHARIQASLGHGSTDNDAPVTFEGRVVDVQAQHARRKHRPRLRRGRITAVAAGIIAAVLLVLVVLATLRSAPQRSAEQSVQLAPVNSAAPAR